LVTSSDRQIIPLIVEVRSSAEPAANSEAAPGSFPGSKPERQDAFGGTIRACRGFTTGGMAKHALEARRESNAGALVELRRCRELGWVSGRLACRGQLA